MDAILIYAPYINFFLFLYLLWRFARAPAHAAAASREKEYKRLYEQASLANKEAKEKLEALKQKLSSLEKELSKIEAQAHQTAEAQAAALAKEAEKMSEHLSSEAQLHAIREAGKAKEQLIEDLWKEAKESFLERVQTEFTVKRQKEFLWNSLGEAESQKK